MKHLSWLLLLAMALLVAGCSKSEETTPETLSPMPSEPLKRLQAPDGLPTPAPQR
jgi:hypothetical protein